MAGPVCTSEEFRGRFTDAMRAAGPQYGTPEEMAEYAADMWESYRLDQGQAGETPEDCAEADLSEWGQE